MIDQSRRLRDTFLIKGRDGRRVIGAAVLVCDILQPVEVAAKGDVVHAKTTVTAPPVDEDHGEGLRLVATDARHLQRSRGEIQGLILLLPADLQRDVAVLHPPLRDAVAPVDITHFVIIDAQKAPVVARFQDGLTGKEIILEGF